MNRSINIIGIVFIVFLFSVLFGAVYTVDEREQVVITQFGEPIGEPVTEPGLKFKLPLIQRANYFEKRVINWDGDPKQVPTLDKKYIWIDTSARWRITDPLKFLQAVGTERDAQARLDDILNSAARDIISGHILVEAIRDSNRVLDERVIQEVVAISDEALERISVGRRNLEQIVKERAEDIVPQYGIELVDVRIKRINYVDAVRDRVFDRMISERRRAAEEYRSEGRGRSAEIEGRRQRELMQISSQAYRTAQTIRGEADSEAVGIYADAYDRDADFFYFMKVLESYEETIDDKTTLILTTDGDYFKHIDKVR